MGAVSEMYTMMSEAEREKRSKDFLALFYYHQQPTDPASASDEQDSNKPTTTVNSVTDSSQISSDRCGLNRKQNLSVHTVNSNDPSVQPGAFYVNDPCSSQSEVSDDGSSQRSPIVATVVNDEEYRQEIEQEILQRVVQADVTAVTDEEIGFKKKDDVFVGHTWNCRKYVCAILIVCIPVIILIAIATTLLKRKAATSTSAITPSSFSDEPKKERLNQTVMQLIESNDTFSVLATCIATSVYRKHLGTKSATLFAPLNITELHFTAYPSTVWTTHTHLLLGSLILTEALNASKIFRRDEIQTLGGWNFTVNDANSTIDGVKIVSSDIPAVNGYIQVTDHVLLPMQLRASIFDAIANKKLHDFETSQFRKLVSLSNSESVLAQTLEAGLTLFVPIDAAFDSLAPDFIDSATAAGNEEYVKDLVLYHLLEANLLPVVDTGLAMSYIMSNHVATVVASINPTGLSVTDEVTEVSKIPANATSVRRLTLISAPPPTEAVDDNATSISPPAQTETDDNMMSPLLYVNNAAVLDVLYVQNGIIYFIDQVLKPPNLGDFMAILSSTASTEFTSLSSFLSLVNDTAKLGYLLSESHSDGIMVAAPVDSAFSQANDHEFRRYLRPGWLVHLQNILLHLFFWLPEHLDDHSTAVSLSGYAVKVTQSPMGSLSVDGTDPIGAFMFTEVCTILEMDRLVLPPWVGELLYVQLVQDKNVSDFAFVVAKSNLTWLLSSNDTDNDPVTILVPTNAAFSSLGVSKPFNATFARRVVLAHTFAGNLYQSNLVPNITSLNNQTWPVHEVANTTSVGEAKLLQTNQLASNGVMHVIDRVLM